MKPLNSGHLRVLKNVSVIERCPLLGGNLRKIVTFGTLFKACPLFGMFAIGRFHCITNVFGCVRDNGILYSNCSKNLNLKNLFLGVYWIENAFKVECKSI